MRLLADLPIARKLALLVGGLLLLTSSLLVVTVNLLVREMLREEINVRLTATVADRSSMIDAYVRQQHERVVLVASRTRLRQLLASFAAGELSAAEFQRSSRRILVDAQRSTADFLAIAITDTDGTVVTATDDRYLGVSYASEAAFARGQREPYLGDPRPVGERHESLLAAPANSPGGNLIGVVLVVLDVNGLRQILLETPELGASGKLVLGAERDGSVLSLLDALAADPTVDPTAPVPSMTRAVRGDTGFEQVTDASGTPLVAAYRPIGHEAWGIVATMHAAEAYAPLARLRRTLLAIEAVFLVFGLAAAVALARKLTRPVAELVVTATGVARGDLNVRLEVDSDDEIGQLKRTFNQMTEELAASYATLERRVDERTSALQEANAELEREVDSRRRAEAALVQKDKLASLGLLAAGVAHEVNNPLAFVLNNVGILERDLGSLLELVGRYQAELERVDGAAATRLEERAPGELGELRESISTTIDDSIDGLKRMRDIVADLRDFARVDESGHKPADLSRLVTSAATMVRHELDQRQLVLETELPELPPVVCHSGKIKQVVCNLLLNAAQASRAGDTIHLRTTSAGDGSVTIEVEDRGSGIADADLERLFDPFFTTKPVGSGTGLGLSVSYGIVKEHSGEIEVASELGVGSRFRVILPTGPGEQGV